jgi:hypothetical protein
MCQDHNTQCQRTRSRAVTPAVDRANHAYRTQVSGSQRFPCRDTLNLVGRRDGRPRGRSGDGPVVLRHQFSSTPRELHHGRCFQCLPVDYRGTAVWFHVCDRVRLCAGSGGSGSGLNLRVKKLCCLVPKVPRPLRATGALCCLRADPILCQSSRHAPRAVRRRSRVQVSFEHSLQIMRQERLRLAERACYVGAIHSTLPFPRSQRS